MRSFLCLAMTALLACSVKAQDLTVPPATEHVVLTLQGKGAQIYTCKANQWVFVAPAARLFDANGAEVGTHGDGPVWHLQDGSLVTGKVIAKTASTDAGSVPWLLLSVVTSTGPGKLAAIEFIRRSETKGGISPTVSCDTGALLRVPYEATYTFLSSR